MFVPGRNIQFKELNTTCKIKAKLQNVHRNKSFSYTYFKEQTNYKRP